MQENEIKQIAKKMLKKWSKTFKALSRYDRDINLK